MKRLFLFLFLVSFNSESQIVNKRYYDQFELIRNVKKIKRIPTDRIIFNIRFIYFGYNRDRLTKESINMIKSRLDNVFNSTIIRFTYDDMIYSYKTSMNIDSCYEYGCRIIDRRTYKRSDINIYIVENVGKMYNGLSSYPSSDVNTVFIYINSINDGTIEHEMGHFFGLLHTFEGTRFVSENDSENEGDMIKDTKTDLNGIKFSADCKLSENIKDNKGNIFDIDLSNYMSYYGRCRSRFTNGQISLMNKVAYYRTLFK